MHAKLSLLPAEPHVTATCAMQLADKGERVSFWELLTRAQLLRVVRFPACVVLLKARVLSLLRGDQSAHGHQYALGGAGGGRQPGKSHLCVVAGEKGRCAKLRLNNVVVLAWLGVWFIACACWYDPAMCTGCMASLSLEVSSQSDRCLATDLSRLVPSSKEVKRSFGSGAEPPSAWTSGIASMQNTLCQQCDKAVDIDAGRLADACSSTFVPTLLKAMS